MGKKKERITKKQKKKKKKKRGGGGGGKRGRGETLVERDEKNPPVKLTAGFYLVHMYICPELVL